MLAESEDNRDVASFTAEAYLFVFLSVVKIRKHLSSNSVSLSLNVLCSHSVRNILALQFSCTITLLCIKVNTFHVFRYIF